MIVDNGFAMLLSIPVVAVVLGTVALLVGELVGRVGGAIRDLGN